MRTVLMVAEKPSIAEAIAHHLGGGRSSKRPHGALPTYEYTDTFFGQPAHFRVTSTTGHIFGCDFTPEYQNWDRTEEEDLFSAPTIKKEAGGAKVVHHLSREAESCDTLVLWLDCDREGENICFEVMSVVRRSIHLWDRIWRAHFSALTFQELRHAMDHLQKPNENVSDSVECRQELDLKVGCSFTRFQTKYFQGKYGDLDASVVSYGPCQTPTLGFCVARHDEIVNFKSEGYWKVVPVLNRSGFPPLVFDWERMRCFDEIVARMLLQKCMANGKTARVVEVIKTRESKPRPPALNTVELLKVASRVLGMSPAHAMSVAEHLYISGYISYPRTESTAYPPSFDLRGVLNQQTHNSSWGQYVRETLLDGGQMVRPKTGKDMGDHPPITPMKSASQGELSGDSWRLYEYVARHFIATVAPDCKYLRTRLVICLGAGPKEPGEFFMATGKIIEEKGFTEILQGLAVKDEKMPDLKEGDDLNLSDIRLVSGKTQPPGYLTESDLIGLMERNGIGTDASIPTHINNICERNYVAVKAGRTIEPTKLGIILIRGICNIDPQLVQPLVRSHVEELVTHIAEGRANKTDVLNYALDLFQEKFRFFKTNIAHMDGLMEASFSPLTATGKPLVRCGNCTHYMKHLEARPQRLYCGTCAVTLALPQGGTIKQYGSFVCPIDGFELIICHIDQGKSFALCPWCYNHPPFEAEKIKDIEDSPAAQGQHPSSRFMSCSECTHPTCIHSMALNNVCDCVDEYCHGVMVFVRGLTGKWRVCCNKCNMMLLLPAEAAKIHVDLDHTCPDCGSNKLEIAFPRGKSPLITREEQLTACIFCDERLAPLVKEVRGRMVNFRGGRGGRGGRGRGRGRGFRGRGRGGGRSIKGDPMAGD